MQSSQSTLRLLRTVAARPACQRALTPSSSRICSPIVTRDFSSGTGLLDENKSPKPSKEEDPVSFRLSLYQSTFDRVQREKAESDRMAKIRGANDKDWIGKYFGTIACMSSYSDTGESQLTKSK